LTAIKSETETVMLNSKTPNKQSKLLAGSVKSHELLDEPLQKSANRNISSTKKIP
jgi:hypothetical protein